MKELKKMLKNKVSSLLIIVSLLAVPSSMKAQPQEYRSDQGALVGTSDSRMFVTVNEDGNHVEFKVSLLGELTARSIDFILLYDTAKLRLTDSTYLYDIPNGFNTNDFGSPVITSPELFKNLYPEHFLVPSRHRPILSGDATRMKYFVSEIININPYSAPIHLSSGEMIHAYSIYCRKVNPEMPLADTDFGYYAQTQRPTADPVQAPYWTYDACQIRFANGMPSAYAYIKPQLFTYRSPSYVVTAGPSSIRSTSAVLNATFTRGDISPKNNLIVSSYRDATYYGLLNWDAIAQCGFIYSLTDATITVNGYAKKLNIDGTDYDFPTNTELAAGEFIRNDVTFYIKQQQNSAQEQTVPISQMVDGLISGNTYYVWSFIHYTFETSDPCLFVGNKISFDAVPLIDCSTLADQNIVLCQSGSLYYTHTGTSWDAVANGTTVLNSLTYRLDGATTGTGTTLNGTDFNAGTTTVTWIGTNNSGDVDSCKFNVEVTINPSSNGAVVYTENLIYCHGEEIPEYTFEGTTNTTFHWEKILGYDFGLAQTEGVNTIPAFVAQNFGFEHVSASYKVTPVGEYGCTGETKYFLITVNPKPATSPVEDMIYCNGVTAPRFDFTSNMPDAFYEWEFVNEAGNVMINGIPSSGENFIPGFVTHNTGNEPIVGKYRVRASYAYDNLACYDDLWQYFNIVILPAPQMPAVTPALQTICSNEATTPVTFSGDIAEVTYIWSFTSGDMLEGFPTHGEGNIPAYVVQNNGLMSVTATYNAVAVLNYENYPAYTCESKPTTFSIIVSPVPHTNPVQNFVYCNGTIAPGYYFTGNNTLATYTWEYVSGAMLSGVPQNGFNYLPAFTAVNNGNEPVTANYRVQASYGEFCPENEWVTFSITVLPTPTVTVTPAYQELYSGETMSDITFGSNVENVIFTWERIGGFISEIPVSGEGNITGMTIYNNDLLPALATYKVEAKLNYAQYPQYSCSGQTAQFTVKVNPAASSVAVSNFVYCNGATAPVYTFTGSNPLATYTWEYVSGAVLGIPQSGINNFPSFVALNSGNAPLTANYRVRSSYGSANSEWVPFTVTVLPTPTVTATPAHQTICQKEVLNDIIFDSNVQDVIYQWTRIEGNIPEIPAAGEGNISGIHIENNTLMPISATYSVVAKLNYADYPDYTCTGTPTQFSITVNPELQVTSPEHAGVICSGTSFEYLITANAHATKILWERIPNPDINSNQGANGQSADINETLINTAASDVTVTYLITLVSGSCEYTNVGKVEVVVTPDIKLSIESLTVVCSTESTVTLAYDINIPGAQYTLVFAPEGTAAGFVNISDYMPLSNAIMVNLPQNVKAGNYMATLTLKHGNCIKTYDIVIAVKSAPILNNISESELALCENAELNLFVEMDGNVQYQWFFNGAALPNETNAYYKTVFDVTKAGEYAVEVTGDCGTVTYEFTVIQNPAMIKMKWNDVMYVANADNLYVGYQWYKNGKPIAQNGQDQYYSETGGFTPHAEYTVKAFKADGTYDEACPIVPNDGSKNGGSALTIYPNPATGDATLTFVLTLPEGDWSDADAFIYNMNGKTVKQFKITGNVTEISLNVAAGTYAVRVLTAKGSEFVDKLIIAK